jgi:hypothetical protein
VDLVLTWPKQKPVFIEIKSAREVTEQHAKGLVKTEKDFVGSRLLLVSQDPHQRNIGAVECLTWQSFLQMLIDGKLG